MSDLTIVVSVRDNRTMSQYAMPRNRKLTFVNDSDQQLVVTAKTGSPFVDVDDPSILVGEVRVEPRGEKSVRIKKTFQDSEFGYTARIGNTEEDDPIVILERPR